MNPVHLKFPDADALWAFLPFLSLPADLDLDTAMLKGRLTPAELELALNGFNARLELPPAKEC